jgi:Mitochondrial biogenesis AIM24
MSVRNIRLLGRGACTRQAMLTFLARKLYCVLRAHCVFSVDCDLDCQPTICCCAGFGACRQKLKGTDGSIAFLSAGGTIVYRKLAAGEKVTVDTRSIVAMEDSVSLGVMWNGYCTCCCGGESCYSATLTGPGKRTCSQLSGTGAAPLCRVSVSNNLTCTPFVYV